MADIKYLITGHLVPLGARTLGDNNKIFQEFPIDHKGLMEKKFEQQQFPIQTR